jgi:ribose transport system ATP-binding protein
VTPTDPAPLAIENLSKRYGETVALDRVSITFQPGTVHTILGENGSGKSTLVKLLSGIVLPDSGITRIGGRPFAGTDPAAFQRAGVATVFQEVLIAPDRSVADNVLLGFDSWFTRRVPRRDRRALVGRTLGEFASASIPPDLRAGSLSLAAQQLVVLARALVRRPRILILDEITAALDFTDREAVFGCMERLAREGVLLLFITHRMDEVMRLSDRISVLRSGRLVATLDRGNETPEGLLRLMAPETARDLAHA